MKLPEKFTFEEVMDRILLLEKIEIGLQEMEKGEVVQDDEVDQHLAKWLK